VRVYAVEEGTQRRFLVRLECDGTGCDATIKPHPEINKSGWTKRGVYYGPGDSRNLEWDYCSDCPKGAP
jgi:hypothetical protein